jgi:hypothetical protein
VTQDQTQDAALATVRDLTRRFGFTAEMIGTLPPDPFARQRAESATLLARHAERTYGDQKGQVDILINCVFDYGSRGLRRDGYFVDLACADGVTISNTRFLERHLGWRGLLFEPNPKFHESIAAHRSSPLVTKCVTDRVGSSVRFRIDNDMLGGIVSDETDNSPAMRGEELKAAEILEIETTTLAHELDRVEAPQVIDFLSLDIEGAEWIALRSFPFERYRFRCMTIERPTPELDLLLDRHGYRQVAHLKYDVVYVHQIDLPDVNLSPSLRFAFTPPKDW